MTGSGSTDDVHPRGDPKPALKLRGLGMAILLGMLAAVGLHYHTRQYMGPQAAWTYLTQSLPRELGEFWRPGAGEWVLPDPVEQALILLRRHDVKSFRASPGWYAVSPEYLRRLEESAWPIRIVNAAPWYIALTGEPLPAGCTLVEKQEKALLARCPLP